MKKLFGAFTFVAAASVAFLSAPRAHAQLVTFETLTSYNGAGIIGFASGSTALTQTFNNILELQSITFRIATTGTTTADQSFSAYLVQWNPTTNKVTPTFSAPLSANGTSDTTTATSTVAIQNFTVPPTGTGAWATDTFATGGNYSGYDVTLNLNQYTDPALTYAIVLVDNTATSGLGLLDVTGSVADPINGDAFAYGNALSKTGVNNSAVVSTLESSASFVGPSGGNGTGDYGFSQIVVVPVGNVVPVPEPRTAAAILCALFVAGLVARQLILRRKEDAMTGVALAT